MTIVGKRIQHYVVVESLGAGGMGEVYVARDERLKRDVALKAIRPERQMRPGMRQRLLDEARALSRLEHPSICRIHDYLEDGEAHYLVLELIRGRPLDQELGADVPQRTRLQWAIQIADALVAAHGAGIVHRDLKPSNIMIDASGRARILDFGLAQEVRPLRLAESREGGTDAEEALNAADPEATLAHEDATTTAIGPDGGSISGTPLYMSPEQARGEPTGTASDLFSYGLVLHELFGGTRAYSWTSPQKLAETITVGRTARVKTRDAELTRLIERLKTPAPSGRPTAVEALSLLERIRGKPARRLRRGIAAAVVLVALGGGLKYTLDVRRERQRAEFRRGQAEGLIEFMLGDLRERLEPVGRLDALSAVGDEALAYFASLETDKLSHEDRERYGRTLSQLGEVKIAGGDLDGAMAAYLESVRVYEGLVADDPSDGSLKIALGGARFGVGSVHWERDELDEARRAFEEYLELAVAVYDQDPDDETNRLELGYALTNVAAVNEAVGNQDLAFEQLERAIEIKRTLVEDDPDNGEAARSLANTLVWMADSVENRGGFRRALDLQLETLDLRRRLVDERDAESRRMLSLSLGEVGRLSEQVGLDAAATAVYLEDVRISRSLHLLDPANAEWKRGLVIALYNRSRTVSREETRGLLEEAMRLSDELARVEPDNAIWRIDRMAVRRDLAELAFEAGDPATATRWLAAHANEADVEPGSRIARELARAALLRGRILFSSGEADTAKEIWDRGILWVEGDDSIAGMPFRFELLHELDRRAEAGRLLTALANLGYADSNFRGYFDEYRIKLPAPDGTAP